MNYQKIIIKRISNTAHCVVIFIHIDSRHPGFNLSCQVEDKKDKRSTVDFT